MTKQISPLRQRMIDEGGGSSPLIWANRFAERSPLSTEGGSLRAMARAG